MGMGDMKDDMSIPLSWTEPVNTGGHPILHYIVQQRDAYQDKFQTIADKVEGTRASATELTPGVTYFFRVIAVTELGREDQQSLKRCQNVPRWTSASHVNCPCP